MKSDSELNEAAVVAGFSSFNKELSEIPCGGVSAGAFVSAVGRLVNRIFPGVVSALYYRLDSGGELACSAPMTDAPCKADGLASHLAATKKIDVEYHNRGGLVDRKYSAYAIASFFLKKELFFSVVLCGRRREIRSVAQTLPSFHSYVASEFRRLHAVHKELRNARRSEQAAMLTTARSLLRNRAGKRWFAEHTESATPFGTDFTNLYHCGNDTWLSCLFDVTVSASARLQVMVLLDAYMSLLAEEGCATGEIARRTLLSIKKKTMEAYLSFVIARYDKAAGTIDMTGAGSCTAFFVSHDSGRATELGFGSPAGTQGSERMPAFTSKQLSVTSGDILCLCSDGLAQAARTQFRPFWPSIPRSARTESQGRCARLWRRLAPGKARRTHPHRTT